MEPELRALDIRSLMDEETARPCGRHTHPHLDDSEDPDSELSAVAYERMTRRSRFR